MNSSIKRTQAIEYFDGQGMKVQTIYSTLNVAEITSTDTSLIIQKQTDSRIVEEIHYDLINGDSVKWLHTIKKYNDDNLIIEEIDSIEGALSRHVIHQYDKTLLQRSENLSIIPRFNNNMDQIGLDTLRSIINSYYDGKGINDKVVSISKNEISILTETVLYDTTVTFNSFDSLGKKNISVSLINGDTIGIIKTEHDRFGRETLVLDASLEFGITTFKYKYDDSGNRIYEREISDGWSNLIITQFDKQNRPVKRIFYNEEIFTESH